MCLSIHNLSYVGDNQVSILENINLDSEKDTITAVIGGNGSGKSTLFKCIAGMLNYSGEIVINPSARVKPKSTKHPHDILLLTQNANENLFPKLTVADNIALWLSAQEKRYTQKEVCNYLEKFNPTLIQRLTKPLFSLSGGEKQVLMLALGLLLKPKIILLDEHTSQLDPNIAKKVMAITHQAIKSEGVTALMITHHLDDALSYADTIVVLKDGKLSETYKDLANLNKLELLANCYG